MALPVSSQTAPRERYVKNERIGHGAYKTVFAAIDRDKGIAVAWNEIELGGEVDVTKLAQELELLGGLHNEHIMELYDSWVDEKAMKLIFITELMTSGSLRSFVQKARSVALPVIREWSRQILSGLAYLHARPKPIIHRDIKLDNIFFHGTQGRVKIGDLGLATVLDTKAQPRMSVIGTPEFMAPEFYVERYDVKVDIWAFGLCVIEMVTLEYPYAECTNVASLFRTVSAGMKPAALARIGDAGLFEFICCCLETDPLERFSAQGTHIHSLLEHPWLEVEEPSHYTRLLADEELAAVRRETSTAADWQRFIARQCAPIRSQEPYATMRRSRGQSNSNTTYSNSNPSGTSSSQPVPVENKTPPQQRRRMPSEAMSPQDEVISTPLSAPQPSAMAAAAANANANASNPSTSAAASMSMSALTARRYNNGEDEGEGDDDEVIKSEPDASASESSEGEADTGHDRSTPFAMDEDHVVHEDDHAPTALPTRTRSAQLREQHQEDVVIATPLRPSAPLSASSSGGGAGGNAAVVVGSLSASQRSLTRGRYARREEEPTSSADEAEDEVLLSPAPSPSKHVHTKHIPMVTPTPMPTLQPLQPPLPKPASSNTVAIPNFARQSAASAPVAYPAGPVRLAVSLVDPARTVSVTLDPAVDSVASVADSVVAQLQLPSSARDAVRVQLETGLRRHRVNQELANRPVTLSSSHPVHAQTHVHNRAALTQRTPSEEGDVVLEGSTPDSQPTVQHRRRLADAPHHHARSASAHSHLAGAVSGHVSSGNGHVSGGNGNVSSGNGSSGNVSGASGEYGEGAEGELRRLEEQRRALQERHAQELSALEAQRTRLSMSSAHTRGLALNLQPVHVGSPANSAGLALSPSSTGYAAALVSPRQAQGRGGVARMAALASAFEDDGDVVIRSATPTQLNANANVNASSDANLDPNAPRLPSISRRNYARTPSPTIHVPASVSGNPSGYSSAPSQHVSSSSAYVTSVQPQHVHVAYAPVSSSPTKTTQQSHSLTKPMDINAVKAASSKFSQSVPSYPPEWVPTHAHASNGAHLVASSPSQTRRAGSALSSELSSSVGSDGEEIYRGRPDEHNA